MSQIKIDSTKCIGCSTCVIIDPDSFELDPKTSLAKVKPSAVVTKKTKTAVESCPVAAISIEK
jgi:ferredoxin